MENYDDAPAAHLEPEAVGQGLLPEPRAAPSMRRRAAAWCRGPVSSNGTENPDSEQRRIFPRNCFVAFTPGPRIALALHMSRNGLLLVSLAVAFTTAAQVGEDVVKKDSISVHTVERGSMSIFASASGTLTSVQPPRAILRFESSDGNCEQGRDARLVMGDNPKSLAGKVAKRTNTGDCEVEFLDWLPPVAVAGIKVGGLVVSREMKDVVFFGRPADSKANSTATVFVLDGPSDARRVTVRYGVLSGPVIQVLDGLAPGDKVIVTDMSKWAHLARVRLE